MASESVGQKTTLPPNLNTELLTHFFQKFIINHLYSDYIYIKIDTVIDNFLSIICLT